MVTEESIKQFSVQCSRIFEETGKDMIGQSEVVENTIVALIAGGNVLLEGVPGVGKTRLVRTLSRVFNLPFSRIQFTPDLMPADVTSPVRFLPTWFWRTKSTVQRRRHSPRCWKPCRSTR